MAGEMSVRILYLDIDGVLNAHKAHANGYCGIKPSCALELNVLLMQFPDLKLVISSAWRYLVLGGAMTERGFESLLLTHGLDCYGRVLGVTPRDEEYLPSNPAREDYAQEGCAIRARQILEHLEHSNPYSYAVLDDMEVPVNRLVRTDGNRGLQPEHVLQLAVWLQKPLS